MVVRFRHLALILPLVAATACSPRVYNHGNQPDSDVLGQIAPGTQTKAQVQQMLGSPSSVAAFDENTWYYISQTGERTWFFPEETVGRQVVRIRFGDEGRVSEVSQLSLEDGQEVAMVDRVTPTEGAQLTFVQQMWQALIGGPTAGNFLGGEIDASQIPR